MRNPQQLNAISDLSPNELADFRKFEKLEENDTTFSCWSNGMDSAIELGITEENGFSYSEYETAKIRFTIATAKMNDLI